MTLKELEACIQAQTEPEPFSGLVSLRQGDEVIFEKGYGLAIRSESIPNRGNTRFQMASGCKVFTSVAICQLVEQGEVGFDTPLGACVDAEFPGYSPDITLHHLLTHTSGITSYFEEDIDPDYEALWKNLPVYRVRGPRDFLPLFQHKPMKFSPGERFDYNDGGYILLGLVVECVTGMSFASYVREKIFEPAGMVDSGYYPADRLPERTALAYIRDDDGTWRTNIFAVPMVGGPDGGAYTTAADMARFWRVFKGNEAEVATALKPPCTHYGYGVWIDRRGGATRKIFVEGFDPGVAMRSAVYPDKDLILTVMGNTAHALWPLYGEIERVLRL